MKTIVDYATQIFPSFSQEIIEQLIKNGRLMKIKAGQELMSIGGSFKTIPLIVEGSIKVVREDQEGNELFLYFLEPGETCAMSISCSLQGRPSEVNAVAEEDSVLIAIPGDKALSWMSEFDAWRDFMLGTFQLRFQEMMHAIDSIAFKQLDVRLLEYLRDKAQVHDSKEIQTTHQSIADDLNSTREVISSLLKILEKEKQIKLGRNKITLV
jgi:CRP/FNR family transcriptional regulator